MHRRKFLTTGVALTTASVLAGCGSGDNGDSASGNGDGESGNGDSANGNGDSNSDGGDGGGDGTIEIIEHEMTYDDMMGAAVEGTVQNNTGEEQSYIQVEAQFFDDGGTRIGDGMWNANDVPDGQELTFETIPASTDEEPADYEVETSTSP